MIGSRNINLTDTIHAKLISPRKEMKYHLSIEAWTRRWWGDPKPMDEHEISPVGHESFPFEVSVLNHFTSQRTLANAPLCRKKRAKKKTKNQTKREIKKRKKKKRPCFCRRLKDIQTKTDSFKSPPPIPDSTRSEIFYLSSRTPED